MLAACVLCRLALARPSARALGGGQTHGTRQLSAGARVNLAIVSQGDIYEEIKGRNELSGDIMSPGVYAAPGSTNVLVAKWYVDPASSSTCGCPDRREQVQRSEERRAAQYPEIRRLVDGVRMGGGARPAAATEDAELLPCEPGPLTLESMRCLLTGFLAVPADERMRVTASQWLAFLLDIRKEGVPGKGSCLFETVLLGMRRAGIRLSVDGRSVAGGEDLRAEFGRYLRTGDAVADYERMRRGRHPQAIPRLELIRAQVDDRAKWARYPEIWMLVRGFLPRHNQNVRVCFYDQSECSDPASGGGALLYCGWRDRRPAAAASVLLVVHWIERRHFQLMCALKASGRAAACFDAIQRSGRCRG